MRTACVLPMRKAGSYFRLRSLLLSVCSFVLAPDRTEPPLWECVPDLFASRLSISNFVCRYVKIIYIYQPHLARRRDRGEQGRPSSARAAVVRVREIVARVLPEHAVFCLLRRWRCRWLLRLLLLRAVCGWLLRLLLLRAGWGRLSLANRQQEKAVELTHSTVRDSV